MCTHTNVNSSGGTTVYLGSGSYSSILIEGSKEVAVSILRVVVGDVLTLIIILG